MSVEKVKEYLKKFGVDDRVMEFAQSSATVELAAEAVGCEPARIAKTLSLDVNGKVILVVTAGDVKVDNPKYKSQFGVKARMLTPDEAVSRIGFAVGGICPFAVDEEASVYLDDSLKRFETVFPSGGSNNSAIELTIPELEKYSNCTAWIDVTKAREARE